MSALQNISTCVIVFVALYIIKSSGLQSDFKKCRGIDIDLAEEHAMHMSECLKQYNADDVMNVEPQQMACFGKCVFVQKGLLDAAGHPHKEKLSSIIIDHLPEVVHKELTVKLEECLHTNITELIDPEDESCTTYVPMMMCIHLSFMEECEKTS